LRQSARAPGRRARPELRLRRRRGWHATAVRLRHRQAHRSPRRLWLGVRGCLAHHGSAALRPRLLVLQRRRQPGPGLAAGGRGTEAADGAVVPVRPRVPALAVTALDLASKVNLAARTAFARYWSTTASTAPAPRLVRVWADRGDSRSTRR